MNEEEIQKQKEAADAAAAHEGVEVVAEEVAPEEKAEGETQG